VGSESTLRQINDARGLVRFQACGLSPDVVAEAMIGVVTGSATGIEPLFR